MKKLILKLTPIFVAVTLITFSAQARDGKSEKHGKKTIPSAAVTQAPTTSPANAVPNPDQQEGKSQQGLLPKGAATGAQGNPGTSSESVPAKTPKPATNTNPKSKAH